MLLIEVEKYIECKRIYNLKKNTIFNSIFTNSKHIKKYSIFAIEDKKTFKKEYIKEAIKNGAVGILTNKEIKNIKITQYIVENIHLSLTTLLNKIKPVKPLNSIAITGTNGKTTVAWYISQICLNNKIKTKYYGTLGYYVDTKKKIDSNLTTPEFEILYQTAFKAKKNVYNYIFEASSHALDQNRLKNFPVNIAALTNITHDHLDYHKNFKNYQNAKFKLFINHLEKNGYAILNNKINRINFLKKKLFKTNKIISFGTSNSDIYLSNHDKKIKIVFFKKNYLLTLDHKSPIELENISCAIACCYSLGIKVKDILNVLKKITNPPGRLEKVTITNKNLNIYVDYAHTPDALKKILSDQTVDKKKPSVVFGCGGNRDKAKRIEMGKIANIFANRVYITDDNPRKEKPSAIRKTILSYCKKGIEIADREKAISQAVEDLILNETLIIAGKGHENIQINNRSIRYFSDLKIARQELKKKNLTETVKKYLINNFNKIKINSQDISKGDVFLALPGEKKHGSAYIKDALGKGAKYIITDKITLTKLINSKIITFNNPLFFLLKIATLKRTLFKGKVVGITGSIGKTSLKENLKYFLSADFTVSASIKSYNNYLGIIVSLLNLNLKSDFAIFELGTSNFSEIKKLTSLIMPSQTIITNIFPTHLEKLINTRNIAKEKSDIFNIKHNPNIKLVILSDNNIDEKYIVKKAIQKNISSILTFGKNISSNLKILNINNINNLHSKITLIYKDKKINFCLNYNQLHKLDNFLICILFFIYNKIDIKNLLSRTQTVPLVEGRGLYNQIIFHNKQVTLIDESYNASPQTMKNAINYIKNLDVKKNQNKFLVLGDMLELGDNKLKYHIDLLNYVFEKKLDNVIICGKLMKIALKKSNNVNIIFFMNIESILKYLKKKITDNDIILIKGSNSSLTNKLAKDFLVGEAL